MNPFIIFDREIDEVILVINYYLMLGNEPKKTQSHQKRDDGFFDM